MRSGTTAASLPPPPEGVARAPEIDAGRDRSSLRQGGDYRVPPIEDRYSPPAHARRLDVEGHDRDRAVDRGHHGRDPGRASATDKVAARTVKNFIVALCVMACAAVYVRSHRPDMKITLSPGSVPKVAQYQRLIIDGN